MEGIPDVPWLSRFAQRNSGEEKAFRDGAHRSRPPDETVAEFSTLMSPMGITRLADVTGLDVLGIPVYTAIRPLSRSLVVSMGKGSTVAAAKASALMESIEAWHAEHTVLPGRRASYKSLSATWAAVIDVTRLPRLSGITHRGDLDVEWVEGVELFTDCPVWIPAEVVSLDFRDNGQEESGLLRGSNGLASGNTLAEAAVHALCEVIERDAEVLWRMGPVFRRVRTSTVADANCRRLLNCFEAHGIDVAGWDITSDTGIPAYGCTLVPREAERFWRPVGVHDGYGCHPSPAVALARALTEAAQTRLAYISGSRDDLLPEEFAAASWPELVAEASKELASIDAEVDFPPEPEPRGFIDDLNHILAGLRRAGVEQAALVDLSQSAYGVPVVRALVPGLEGPAGAAEPGARAMEGAR